jgi:hypothetical protein
MLKINYTHKLLIKGSNHISFLTRPGATAFEEFEYIYYKYHKDYDILLSVYYVKTCLNHLFLSLISIPDFFAGVSQFNAYVV